MHTSITATWQAIISFLPGTRFFFHLFFAGLNFFLI
jgi:hypothetical protein